MSENENKTVVAVKLRYNPKTYWFDPALSSYQRGDHVLVDTERGREIGLVLDPALEVTPRQLKSLNTSLKPVIRVLSELDYDHIDALDAKGREAMPVFRELIEKYQLDMKPVAVEYLFSGDKAVFYFSNDERVDFRELVRDLAARFHVRVDMRQIGVRDEARIIGGLSHCGEELCCARMGGEFQPVSIRMAKEQDLPLNPAKISGACGRLMCCLRYEFEAYKDFKSRAPRKGSLIETPLGAAKVVDFDTPREVVTMRLEDGKMLSIPLREFECDCDENGCSKPCRVSREAVNRCASSSILLALGALEREQELLSEIADGRRQAADTRTPRRTERKRRERGADKGAAGDGAASSGRRARPARGDAETDSESTTSSEARRRPRQRPGQRSSGLRRTSGGQRSSQGSPASGGQSAGSSQSRQSQSAGGDSKSTGDRRRRRRRSSGGGSGSSPGASSGAGRDSSSGTSSGATS